MIMKYFASVALALLGAILVGCSGNGGNDHASHDHGSETSESSHSDEHGADHDTGMADHREQDGDASVQGNATCPVMTGDAVDPEIFTVKEGRKVYFCCDDCIDKFNQDPETYSAKAYPHASGD